MDTSLQESDVVTPSVSSGFLHSVSTISDNSRPQLAPSIRTRKLWCLARALLTPVSLATKMLASKLIRYFSSHPAAFGFWASTPPDNISLNLANRKVDQSLSDFQTDLGATAHATLDTEQLISRLQVALVDTLSSLPEAEGDVIPVHSSLFSTVLGRWFLLVRHVSMAVLIGLWHRLILWVCLHPFLLKGVARPAHRLGSNSQYTRDLCQALCQGLVGSLLVVLFPPVLLSQDGKVGHGGQCS